MYIKSFSVYSRLCIQQRVSGKRNTNWAAFVALKGLWLEGWRDERLNFYLIYICVVWRLQWTYIIFVIKLFKDVFLKISYLKTHKKNKTDFCRCCVSIDTSHQYSCVFSLEYYLSPYKTGNLLTRWTHEVILFHQSAWRLYSYVGKNILVWKNPKEKKILLNPMA